MRIAAFGATGMVGTAVTAEAGARGHHVTAVSRHPDAAAATDRLAVRAADIADPGALDAVLADVDTAVLTIRLAPGDEHRLAPLTTNVLDSAARHGTRVLIVGGSAPLCTPDHPHQFVIDDLDRVPEAWQAIARASLDQFRACLEHPFRSWVYLSPPAVLEPGERTGRYRRGSTILLTDSRGESRITAPDLAIAVLDELEHPGRDRHFTVGRSEPGVGETRHR